MNFYFEIKIVPDNKVRENVLLNKVYTELHKNLVVLNSNNIGVSFPEYFLKLGKVLRIHGSETDLNKLQNRNWIVDLSDQYQVSKITYIPQDAKYRIISRMQSTMTLSKLNRLKKRGAITTAEQEKSYKVKMLSKGLDNPYVELVSDSTGHLYRRFLQFTTLSDEPINGEFDTFGLSKTATVPIF